MSAFEPDTQVVVPGRGDLINADSRAWRAFQLTHHHVSTLMGTGWLDICPWLYCLHLLTLMRDCNTDISIKTHKAPFTNVELNATVRSGTRIQMLSLPGHCRAKVGTALQWPKLWAVPGSSVIAFACCCSQTINSSSNTLAQMGLYCFQIPAVFVAVLVCFRDF